MAAAVAGTRRDITQASPAATRARARAWTRRRRLGDQSHVTAVPLAAAVPPGSTSGPGSAVPGGLASPSR